MLKTLGFIGVAAAMAVSAPAYARISANGHSLNGLTINGLTINGLTINGLTINGLTINGLSPSVGTLRATRLALPDGTELNFR